METWIVPEADTTDPDLLTLKAMLSSSVHVVVKGRNSVFLSAA